MRILAAGDPGVLDLAADALAAGELVAVPTDTVYGLAALAASREGCERLYSAKGRTASQPTAVLFVSVDRVLAIMPALSERARAACRELLPGPFTLVVHNGDGLCPWVCGDRPDAIGIRVPAGALELPPIAATSANEPGHPEVSRLDLLPDAIAERVSIGLHAGELPTGAASTVLDLTAWELGGDIVVLRDPAQRAEGAVAALLAFDADERLTNRPVAGVDGNG